MKWMDELVAGKDYADKLGPKILLMGETGTGKTTLAAAFPKPMLILDFDHSLGAIKDKLAIEDIKVMAFHLGDNVYEKLNEVLDDVSKTDFKSIVMDSLPAYAVMLKEEVLRVCRLESKNKIVTNLDFTTDKPEFGHWDLILNRHVSVFERLREFAGYVIVTAGLNSFDNEFSSKDDQTTFGPDIQGAFKNKVGHYFDEMYALRMESSIKGTEPKRELITRPFKSWQAKSRFKVPPEVINEPSYEKLAKFYV